MKDLKTALLTLDNKNIITVEMDNDQEAFIRSYVLNESDRQNMICEATLASSILQNNEHRQQHQWSIDILNGTFLKIDTIQ